jgi:hypothetical protein
MNETGGSALFIKKKYNTEYTYSLMRRRKETKFPRPRHPSFIAAKQLRRLPDIARTFRSPSTLLNRPPSLLASGFSGLGSHSCQGGVTRRVGARCGGGRRGVATCECRDGWPR